MGFVCAILSHIQVGPSPQLSGFAQMHAYDLTPSHYVFIESKGLRVAYPLPKGWVLNTAKKEHTGNEKGLCRHCHTSLVHHK